MVGAKLRFFEGNAWQAYSDTIRPALIEVSQEFEDAAAEVGRMNGAKTVTVDVGKVINDRWQLILEARRYVYIKKEDDWVKTITLE